MFNVETVLNQCAKLHKFTASGFVGCRRLERKKKRKWKKKNKNTSGHNRCLHTF
ncbi:hypothetical protein M9458_051556, partial [Cirrhinus mrigala]